MPARGLARTIVKGGEAVDKKTDRADLNSPFALAQKPGRGEGVVKRGEGSGIVPQKKNAGNYYV